MSGRMQDCSGYWKMEIFLMTNYNAIVLPDKFREDCNLSPEELSAKISLLEDALSLGITSITYKSEYVPYYREKHLETVLKQLIQTHFYSRDLEWVWREGVTLLDKDKELWMQIYELIPEVVDSK